MIADAKQLTLESKLLETQRISRMPFEVESIPACMDHMTWEKCNSYFRMVQSSCFCSNVSELVPKHGLTIGTSIRICRCYCLCALYMHFGDCRLIMVDSRSG